MYMNMLSGAINDTHDLNLRAAYFGKEGKNFIELYTAITLSGFPKRSVILVKNQPFVSRRGILRSYSTFTFFTDE